MWREIRRMLAASLHLVLHLGLALVAASGVKLFEFGWDWLFPLDQPYLLGLVPFRWLLDSGEGIIVGVFLVYGVLGAIRIMREE